MARALLESKCKKCLRAKQKLYLKGEKCFSPKCPVTRKNGALPGMHPVSRSRQSEYAVQFREKQKVKNIYGLLEKQFRRYFNNANKVQGKTGTRLLQLLELRLDNAVYRLGMAPSRNAARQLVTHGHIRINNKKADIASQAVRIGDVISIKENEQAREFVKILRDHSKETNNVVPGWLNLVNDCQGEVVSEPSRDMIDKGINEQLIVELYSR